MMDRRTLPALLLLMAGALAAPATAQTTTNTRAAEQSRARQVKATMLTPPRADRLERTLDAFERLSAQFAAGRDGLGVRFGGIEDGSGVAAGPAWKTSELFRGRVHLSASAAASVARDHEYEGAITVPAVGTDRLSVRVSGTATHLAQERFFGAGPSSLRADGTTFALDRREARVEATAAATSWLRIAGSAALARRRAGDGGAAGVPVISSRWQAGTLPGLDSDISYASFGASATVDWRDVPLNPRRGGFYQVRLDRHVDRSHDHYSFTRLNVEVEQHLSWWRRQRVLTLRGMAALSQPDAGHEVPFYLQPTLGGSRVLRGFVTDRFRDRNMLALQAEYAWDLWPFLSAVAFYEGGVVAPEWHDLSFANLKRDYGLGFRLGSARTVALRTDVALGSGEGTRITMRFSHAF